MSVENNAALVARARPARSARSAAVLAFGMLCGADCATTPARAENVDLPELSVAGSGRPRDEPGLLENPAAEVKTTVGRDRVDAAPARSLADVLRDSPGVFVRQGNGPRDISISIRGNNARNIAGVRNLKAYEDGFLLTQPDGASRFDLADPHAYAGIDVYRGPQSALFGNYGTGGAVEFRTRRGAEIGGFEYGLDAGSFGYLSHYATFGQASGPFEFSLFTSDAHGNRANLPNSSFDTQTVNLLSTLNVTPDDRLVVKFINNVVFARIPLRESIDQYRINPFQRGCGVTPLVTPGCPSFTAFNNGAFGATTLVNSVLTGGLRRDRRTIGGTRWEHDFDASTTWRVQVGADDRNITQPLTNTATRGDFPSYNLMTDLTHRGELFGMPAKSYAALTYDFLNYRNRTVNVFPFYGPVFGALTNDQNAEHSNLGGRARTEVQFAPDWLAVLGFSAEKTRISGRNVALANTAAGTTRVAAFADRDFLNAAPEFALQYKITPEIALRGRVAAGYGTPSPTFLFVNAQGLAGNNTSLESQRNVGYDLGLDWTPFDYATVGVTGYYEFFRNEIITQSPGAGLMNFNFNAPRSEHRGVEVFAKADLPSGWNGLLSYSFTDQVYTSYVEQLSAGSGATGRTSRFDRAGFSIPGVPAHTLTARFGYEQRWGDLKGLGAYVEALVQSDYAIDNANLVRIKGFATVNANVHYIREIDNSWIKKLTLYSEVRNIFDQRYVSSVNIISNTISASTGALNPASAITGTAATVYGPGEPRGVFGGIKLAL